MSESLDSNKPTEDMRLSSAGAQVQDTAWTVVARTRRALKDWEDLIQRAPENCAMCYVHLSQDPLRRINGRVYPLRGKPFAGAWGYELTSGDRVYYVPLENERKVVVYYAGKHPKGQTAPPPPRDLLTPSAAPDMR